MPAEVGDTKRGGSLSEPLKEAALGIPGPRQNLCLLPSAAHMQHTLAQGFSDTHTHPGDGITHVSEAQQCWDNTRHKGAVTSSVPSSSPSLSSSMGKVPVLVYLSLGETTFGVAKETTRTPHTVVRGGDVRESEAQMPHMKVEDLSLRCQLRSWGQLTWGTWTRRTW